MISFGGGKRGTQINLPPLPPSYIEIFLISHVVTYKCGEVERLMRRLVWRSFPGEREKHCHNYHTHSYQKMNKSDWLNGSNITTMVVI